MSNGLEREFPEVAWEPVPPIGTRGMPAVVVRNRLARAPELDGRAIRDSARSGLGAIARALLATAMIRRRSRRSAMEGPSERAWASSAPGA